MRKPAAHFKPETKQPTPKKKNVVTATLCIVLALVLVMAVAVTGCNSTNAPESEASSQTSPATPTAEPTPTPEPTRAMSEGRFQVTCQQFADLYISFLQDSESSNSNLVLKADEYGPWNLYKGEMNLDMSLSFESQGNTVTAEETFDTVHFYCSDLVAQQDFYVSPFSAIIQTTHPDLSYGEAAGVFGTYLEEMLDEMNSGDGDTYILPKEIDGINYQMIVSMDATTGKSSLELIASEAVLTTVSSETSETQSDIETTDSPELVTDHEAFLNDYVAKLKVLEMFEENYQLSVTETDGGLSHTFNGESTNVLLTFTADGMVLTSSSTGEVDSTAAFLAMAAIMNTITPSVGSISDCATVVQDMLGELQETGNITEEMVYHTVGNVQYGVTCPGIIVFSVVNV